MLSLSFIYYSYHYFHRTIKQRHIFYYHLLISQKIFIGYYAFIFTANNQGKKDFARLALLLQYVYFWKFLQNNLQLVFVHPDVRCPASLFCNQHLIIKSNEYLLFINEETICPAMYSFQLFLCYEQKKYSYCANKFQDGVYKLCHLMIVKYLWYHKFIPLFVMDTHVVAYLTCFLYSIVAVVAVTLHVWIVSIIKKVPKQNELFTN